MRERRRIAPAVFIVIILLCFFFATSDIGPVKSARDALFGRLGYVSEEEANKGGESAADEGTSDGESAADKGRSGSVEAIDPASLPEYDGDHYVSVNDGVPEFPDDVYKKASLIKDGDKFRTEGSLPGRVDQGKLTPYEYYGELDDRGRCTVAYGCLGSETMPQEGAERGDISAIHPSGWARGQNWERCHLIAWALGSENANPSNLITGTHYLNYDGMRPLEEEVEHYIWNTDNHVLYMARPWFSGNESVARGVQLTAKSIEDNGREISFNVYCFNVTPNASIDYNNGVVTTAEQASQEARLYVINKRSRVFHYPSCEGARSMSPHNREEVTATRTELTSQGYMPCGYCEP